MAGWLTKKFSTIFKGPYMLYLKERREGKRIVILVILLRRYVLERIPEEVRKTHNIDKALKDQDNVEIKAKKIDEKGFRLGFNVELNEEQALQIIRKIEEAWMNARRRHKSLGRTLDQVEVEFQRELLKVLEEGEREDKEVYWKYLEPIIKVAEKSGDHEVLMQRVALLFKREDVSRLAAFAFRWEARGVRKAVVNLKRDEREIKRLLEGLDKKGVSPEKVANNLRACVKKITEHAKNEFRNAYLVWKRDFLLNLVLLRLLDMEERDMMEFVREHLMPRAPEYKNIQDTEVIKKDIAKNCHVLAQGFRRLIGEERQIIAMAREEEGLARRRAA